MDSDRGEKDKLKEEDKEEIEDLPKQKKRRDQFKKEGIKHSKTKQI
jgi:hypothetical protein